MHNLFKRWICTLYFANALDVIYTFFVDDEFQMYFMFVVKLAKQYDNTDEVVRSLMKRHPKLLSDKLDTTVLDCIIFTVYF